MRWICGWVCGWVLWVGGDWGVGVGGLVWVGLYLCEWVSVGGWVGVGGWWGGFVILGHLPAVGLPSRGSCCAERAAAPQVSW